MQNLDLKSFCAKTTMYAQKMENKENRYKYFV